MRSAIEEQISCEGEDYYNVGPDSCEKCGYTSTCGADFKLVDAELLCLGCAGIEPPTCGTHGDF